VGAFAPTEDPALDLLEAAELEPHLDAAGGEVLDFLGAMPLALAHQLAREGIEADADGVMAVAREDAEAFAEVFVDGKIGGAVKTGGGAADGAHALEDEGANLAAGEIEAEEVPLVGDAAEVIGADAAEFVIGAFGFLVAELNLAGPDDGFADGFEQIDICGGGAEAAEGDGGIEVAPLEIDPVAKAVADLLEGGAEGALEGGAAVLLEGLAGDEEGHDFALGDLDVGEIGDGFGVVEAELELVVLDGEAEAVAHEIDVALDGLGGDLEFAGEFAAIGVRAGYEAVVQAQHALEGRPGKAAGELVAGLSLCGLFHTDGDRRRKCGRQGITEGGGTAFVPPWMVQCV